MKTDYQRMREHLPRIYKPGSRNDIAVNLCILLYRDDAAARVLSKTAFIQAVEASELLDEIDNEDLLYRVEIIFPYLESWWNSGIDNYLIDWDYWSMQVED